MILETRQSKTTIGLGQEVRHSDTWIEIDGVYGESSLRLTRSELQKLVEAAPERWFDADL